MPEREGDTGRQQPEDERQDGQVKGGAVEGDLTEGAAAPEKELEAEAVYEGYVVFGSNPSGEHFHHIKSADEWDVQPVHARVELESGQLFVEGLTDVSGVFIQGVAIGQGARTPIPDGDSLTISAYIFDVRREDGQWVLVDRQNQQRVVVREVGVIEKVEEVEEITKEELAEVATACREIQSLIKERNVDEARLLALLESLIAISGDIDEAFNSPDPNIDRVRLAIARNAIGNVEQRVGPSLDGVRRVVSLEELINILRQRVGTTASEDVGGGAEPEPEAPAEEVGRAASALTPLETDTTGEEGERDFIEGEFREVGDNFDPERFTTENGFDVDLFLSDVRERIRDASVMARDMEVNHETLAEIIPPLLNYIRDELSLEVFDPAFEVVVDEALGQTADRQRNRLQSQLPAFQSALERIEAKLAEYTPTTTSETSNPAEQIMDKVNEVQAAIFEIEGRGFRELAATIEGLEGTIINGFVATQIREALEQLEELSALIDSIYDGVRYVRVGQDRLEDPGEILRAGDVLDEAIFLMDLFDRIFYLTWTMNLRLVVIELNPDNPAGLMALLEGVESNGLTGDEFVLGVRSYDLNDGDALDSLRYELVRRKNTTQAAIERAIPEGELNRAISPHELGDGDRSEHTYENYLDGLWERCEVLLRLIEERRGRNEEEVEERGDVLFGDVDSVRSVLGQIESLDDFVLKQPQLFNGKNYASLIEQIRREAGPDVAEALAAEFEARVVLHDSYVVFAAANYAIDPIEANVGMLNLSPEHFETLLHGMTGVRELVPLALGMFEMGFKGLLPGFESDKYTPAGWRSFKSKMERKISQMLGKNGPVAAKIASRLVEATAMPAYYEDQFKFDRAFPQRDVMYTEGRRKYYGDTGRQKKEGKRYAGMTSTIGQYFGTEENYFAGRNYTAVATLHREAGEPAWDLLSDFWMHAVLVDKDRNEVRETKNLGGRDRKVVRTLARNNRYAPGEKPNIRAIRQRLIDDTGDNDILTEEQVKDLEKLKWDGRYEAGGETKYKPMVRYERMHLIPNSDGDGAEGDGAKKVGVDEHAYRKWAEQFSQRQKFHQIVTDPNGPSVTELGSESWFERNQTAFGYLPNSAATLRDLEDEERHKAIRQLQCLYLYSILRHHTPGIQIDRTLWAKPEDLRDAVRQAKIVGFISSGQEDWMIKKLGIGVLGKASRATITDDAFARAGVPGK